MNPVDPCWFIGCSESAEAVLIYVLKIPFTVKVCFLLQMKQGNHVKILIHQSAYCPIHRPIRLTVLVNVCITCGISVLVILSNCISVYGSHQLPSSYIGYLAVINTAPSPPLPPSIKVNSAACRKTSAENF